MPESFASKVQRLRAGRVRILWLVLGALLLVSALPIGLYHRQVLELSQEKLVDTERVQQSELTRSMADEINLFESNLTQQLISQRQILTLTGLIQDVEDPPAQPKVSRLLENFLASNPNTFLYLTAVGRTGKGSAAAQGNFRPEQDPFVSRAMQRAFFACEQALKFRSDPLALAQEDNRPAFVIAVPLKVEDQFTGMLAAVVSLDPLLHRLQETSVRGRTVFIVDRYGHAVAHPFSHDFVPGTDMSASKIVEQIRSLPQDLRATATVSFTLKVKNHEVEMIGTYSSMPELNWAVVAQRSEFHQRTPVRGATEISELAETFNSMAGDIEEFIERLKEAAEENRELFMGSIRMLAAAIDEKDPYTRGHSGRVAKYSLLIAQELGLSPEEIDKLRIAALLHDVGKIGVDDRVLKKPGALTSEEFDLMKQHTVKGANIMRPVSQLKEMLPGIELHHEHIDGRGYPYGLQGPQIPIMARIIAVADTLDAMTTNRPYQSAMELDFALEKIKKLTGTRFDGAVVNALEASIHSGKIRMTAVEVQV